MALIDMNAKLRYLFDDFLPREIKLMAATMGYEPQLTIVNTFRQQVIEMGNDINSLHDQLVYAKSQLAVMTVRLATTIGSRDLMLLTAAVLGDAQRARILSDMSLFSPYGPAKRVHRRLEKLCGKGYVAYSGRCRSNSKGIEVNLLQIREAGQRKLDEWVK